MQAGGEGINFWSTAAGTEKLFADQYEVAASAEGCRAVELVNICRVDDAPEHRPLSFSG